MRLAFPYAPPQLDCRLEDSRPCFQSGTLVSGSKACTGDLIYKLCLSTLTCLGYLNDWHRILTLVLPNLELASPKSIGHCSKTLYGQQAIHHHPGPKDDSWNICRKAERKGWRESLWEIRWFKSAMDTGEFRKPQKYPGQDAFWVKT